MAVALPRQAISPASAASATRQVWTRILSPAPILAAMGILLPIAARGEQPSPDGTANSLEDDFVVPLPRGLSMVFRPIFLEGEGAGGETASREVDLGDSEAGRFAQVMRKATINGSFRREANGRWEWYYYLGKFEVSERQWHAVTDDDETWGAGNDSNLPKRSVNKATIEQFIERMNEWLQKYHPDKLPRDGDAAGIVRLPTADEWEFAARGGSAVSPAVFHSRYPYPEADLGDYEWYGSYNSADGKPRAVGTRRPNALHLHDMVGNVREMMGEPFTIDGTFKGFTVMGSDYKTDKLAVGIRRQPGEPGETVGFRLLLGTRIRPGKERSEQGHRDIAALEALYQAQIEKVEQAKAAERQTLEAELQRSRRELQRGKEELERRQRAQAKAEQSLGENERALQEALDGREQQIASLGERLRDLQKTEQERDRMRAESNRLLQEKTNILAEKRALEAKLEQEAQALRKTQQDLTTLTRNLNEKQNKGARLEQDLTDLERQAKSGDTGAMVALGTLLEREKADIPGAIRNFREAAGRGTEAGWENAERLLRKQAAGGRAESRLELASFITTRNDWRRRKAGNSREPEALLLVACDQDEDAFLLYRELAATGQAAALLPLAQAYWNGRGTIINPVLALKQLDTLSARSEPDPRVAEFKAQISADRLQAEALLRGNSSVTVDTLIRLRPTLKLLAAQSGVRMSGTVSEFFSPDPKYNPEARQFSRADRQALVAAWKKLSANPCDSDALVELGYCSKVGIGIVKDKDLALARFQAAQNLGNPAGTFFVAMERLSSAARLNVAEGQRLLFSAVEQGSAQASYRLAISYKYGKLGGAELPFEKDPVKSFQLFRRALNAGAINAYGELGRFYFYGEAPLSERGQDQKSMALELWKRGQRLGDPLSQEYLQHPMIKFP